MALRANSAAVTRWHGRQTLLTSADRIRGQLPALIGEARCSRCDDELGSRTCVIHRYSQNETVLGHDGIPASAREDESFGFFGSEGFGPQGTTIQTKLGEVPVSPQLGPAVRALGEASRLPAGKRWRGKLGPSLFMTAVEVAPPAAGQREHGESLGRHALRLLGMTAEQRARNDLPPTLGTDPATAADRVGAIRAYAASAAFQTALVPCPKSAQSESGHGWRGLTAGGRRSIRDAGAVMDEQFGSLGFFTATLTDETAATATREQVAEFQTRLLFLIRRQVERLGLPPLVLLVAEMHPHRKTMDGAPVPHWHGVVKVSPGPYQRWLFRKEQFNRAVLQAYRIAFGHRRGHTQRLQLLPQKTGAARYLAKYMAKGGSAVEALKGTQPGRMVPRQWWAWTGELRALVVACRVRPPASFLRWCVRWRHELEHLGEATTGEVQIGSDGPVVGCWFGWDSEAALDRAIRAWIEHELAQIDRATGPPDPGEVGEDWADSDGVIRYGFGGDLPTGWAS